MALIWIPTGIALGFVYLNGAWLLPSIFLAVLIVNPLMGTDIGTTLGFAIANTLSVGVALVILRQAEDFRPGFTRSRDVVIFVGAVLLGSLASSLAAGLTLVGLPRDENFFFSAVHWFLAECLSMIAVAPFYLTNFSGAVVARRWGVERRLESLVLTFFFGLFGYLVFLIPSEEVGSFSRVGALLPVLLWAALRFHPRVISTYIKGLAIASVVGAIAGRGSFAATNLTTSLVETQIYMGIFCVSSLLITAVSYERAWLARERERNLRNIANTIPELVWTTDPQGVNNFLNDRALAFYGLTREDDIRHAWKGFLHPEDLERTDRAWQASIAHGHPYETEHRLQRADGVYEWFLTKANPLRDQRGNIQGWFGASMSVEQQRRTILELEQEKDIRDRMVFMLSHDIRNPLAVIDAGAQVLLKTPTPPELARSFLEQISQNVQRANRMIVDLLDANRLRTGHRVSLKIGPVELVGVLKDTVENLRTIHGDVFLLETPALVEGYWAPEEIRRITENLCVNAVKYGDPARGVRIAVSAPGECGEVILSVHNYGSVIEEDDRGRIFQLFHRTKESLAGDRKGWGIGLTLVQGLTAAHGGRVEVSSAADAGTTFTVRLPLDCRAVALAGR